jgi:hypothetical protein
VECTPGKTCTVCWAPLPLTDFGSRKDKKGRLVRLARCKRCLGRISKIYHAATRERRNERSRDWRRQHPPDDAARERARQSARAYYWTHRSARLEAAKRYAAAYRDRSRAYYWTHRSARLEAARRHYERRRQEWLAKLGLTLEEWLRRRAERLATSRERRHARARLRRAHARRWSELTKGPVDYDAILARDGMVCGICGGRVEPQELQFDHLVPVTKGGAHAEWNLQVAHERCNKSKRDRLPDGLQLRFLV